MIEPGSDPLLARRSQPPAQLRRADGAGQGIGQRLRIVRRHKYAVHRIIDQLRHGRDVGGHAAQALALGLDKDVGQPVTVAVAGDPAGQHEQVRGAVELKHLDLRQGAEPGDALAQPQVLRLGAKLRQTLAAADMGPAPVEFGRQQGEGPQQDIEPLLLDRPAHAQKFDRLAQAIPGRPHPRAFAEALEIETVMAEMHPLRCGRQATQSLISGLRAGDRPARRSQLVLEFARSRRPDVLGMGRARPGSPGEEAGIVRHRGWCMHEMGMKVPDSGGKLRRQHQRLAPAAYAVAGEIVLEIGEKAGSSAAVAGHPAGAPPAPEDAPRLVVEILRQIGNGRGYFAMHRVHLAVGRVAHREQMQFEARPLEAQKLLGDEGLRQARIALEDDRNALDQLRTPISVAGAASTRLPAHQVRFRPR